MRLEYGLIDVRAVQVLRRCELKDDHWIAWARLQASNSHFDSAFYSPDFAWLVSTVRDDLEVGVMSEAGEPVGFFPFLRSPNGVARPVAGRLTEFQGPITKPGLEWDLADLIERVGLQAWYFDHLPPAQLGYVAHGWSTIDSPYADLTKGFDAYELELRERGQTISQVHRKERKLAREVGALRFEMHTIDKRAFDFLLAWKSDQYERTRRLQIFNYPWTGQLLDAVRRHQNDRFAGVMSALYAGGELAAVHLGIRTNEVLHIWFPAYTRTLEQYSPGLILLLHLVQRSAADGIRRVDFGTGDERYKQQFKSGDIPLLIGGVDFRLAHASVRRGWYSVNQWVRRSPYREYLEIPINATRRYRQRLAFR
jgi:CelD/BcsL family acetyltransferase involved in cellulose biosynthesis